MEPPKPLGVESPIPFAADGDAAVVPSPLASVAALVPALAPVPEQSAAVIRFRACRWYQPPENGNGEFCTHREVKPYAGTTGFDASAWCPDCQYHKLRRTPKKRSPDDYSY